LPGELDVLVVGAGFGGLYALHRFRAMGLSVRVVEAGRGVGGTWYWNRYPGARCDVESLAYSYSFSRELELEWDWSERYATQPEILRYANHVADRFDLRRDIRFDTRVVSAHFDEPSVRWRVRLSTGESLSARFCVMATGCLSATNTPDFPGLASFAGRIVHTGQWPEDGVDLAGKRVAIIGTGSSAVQSIPILAEQAEHLVVFQRTPNYSIPARNAPLESSYQAEVKASYAEFRKPYAGGDFGLDFDPSARLWIDATPAEREEEFERRWAAGGLGARSSVGRFTRS
jgi:cyclohexanone monooxygenase